MKDKSLGYALVVSAYASWGILPIFWSLLSGIDPMTVLFQRTVWSAFFLGCVLLGRRELMAACLSVFNLKQLGATLVSTACLGINWFSYVWALKHREYFAASLAYYICPLLTLAAAAVVFGERITTRQRLSLVLLSTGVLLPVVVGGDMPALAVVIASSWSAYTLTRRYFNRPSLQALFLETLLLGGILSIALPLAVGASALVPPATSAWEHALFVTSGVITALPILLLVEGMKSIPLKAVGMLQYVAPTLTLACSVLYFGVEPSRIQLLSLASIWAGLAVFFSSELLALLTSYRLEGIKVARTLQSRSMSTSHTRLL
jgi:chloramphenicol-sensitive protein RarD